MNERLRTVLAVLTLVAVVAAGSVLFVRQTDWWCRHQMPPKYAQLEAAATAVLGDYGEYSGHLDKCLPNHYLSVTFDVSLGYRQAFAQFERHGWRVKENVGMTSPDGLYAVEDAGGHGSHTVMRIFFPCCSSPRS